MNAIEQRLRSYGPTTLLALALVVLAFFYPKYVESLGDLPLIGDFIPGTGSMVIMILVFRPEGLLGERTPEGA